MAEYTKLPNYDELPSFSQTINFQQSTHFVTFILNFIVVFMSMAESMIAILELGFLAITLIQLFLFIQLMRILGYLKNDYAEHEFAQRDESLKSYEVWIQTEILLRVGILFSCFLYMLVRRIYREKYVVRIRSFLEVEAIREARSEATKRN